jgi:hypothetical protein
MEKKKLYYIIGGVSVIGIGIGLYFWNKNKNAGDSSESKDLKTKSAEETTDEPKKLGKPNVDAPAPKPSSKPALAPKPAPKPALAPTTTLADAVTSVIQSAPVTTPIIVDTYYPPTLITRKDKRKACGRRPILKKKRAEWQQCVDAGGVASFEGYSNQWENDYMDFSGLDLDL